MGGGGGEETALDPRVDQDCTQTSLHSVVDYRYTVSTMPLLSVTGHHNICYKDNVERTCQINMHGKHHTRKYCDFVNAFKVLQEFEKYAYESKTSIITSQCITRTAKYKWYHAYFDQIRQQ